MHSQWGWLSSFSFLSLVTLTFWPLTLTFQLRRELCTTAKCDHPTFNHLEVIVRTNTQTDAAENIHLASLRYMPVGNHHMNKAGFATSQYPWKRAVKTGRAGVPSVQYDSAELTMGQWVTGHGSNGSTSMDGSRASWVSTCDPLTRDQMIKSIKISKTISVTFDTSLDLQKKWLFTV